MIKRINYICVSVVLFLVTFSAQSQSPQGEAHCPQGTQLASEPEQKAEKSRTLSCIDGNGMRHGLTITFIDVKKAGQCSYHHGTRHGPCLRWYKSGEKKDSKYFHNGKLHGTVIGWYKNGIVKDVAFYRDGKPVGKWQHWSENGRSEGITKH